MLKFIGNSIQSIVSLQSSDDSRWIGRLHGRIVVWPTTSCFADWLKRRHVTLRIIDCQEGVEYL